MNFDSNQQGLCKKNCLANINFNSIQPGLYQLLPLPHHSSFLTGVTRKVTQKSKNCNCPEKWQKEQKLWQIDAKMLTKNDKNSDQWQKWRQLWQRMVDILTKYMTVEKVSSRNFYVSLAGLGRHVNSQKHRWYSILDCLWWCWKGDTLRSFKIIINYSI